MTDIVERLRRMADMSTTGNDLADIGRAADEIERLRRMMNTTHVILSGDGEYWKDRAERAEAKVAELERELNDIVHSIGTSVTGDANALHVGSALEMVRDILRDAERYRLALRIAGIDPDAKPHPCDGDAAQPSSPPQAVPGKDTAEVPGGREPAAGGGHDQPTPLVDAVVFIQPDLNLQVVDADFARRLERVARQMAGTLAMISVDDYGSRDAQRVHAENALTAWRKINGQ